MSKLLNRTSLRWLLKHPWQFWLSVAGIALGVAIIVAIDIANGSAERAFRLSMNTVAGKATHQIISASGQIPDSIYRNIRLTPGTGDLAPVIEEYAVHDAEEKRIYQLLGLDIFAEAQFRDYLNFTDSSFTGNLGIFLLGRNTILVSGNSPLARLYESKEPVRFIINGKEHEFTVAGLIAAKKDDTSLENVIIMDIASAAAVTGRNGYIDYVNTIMPDEESEKYITSLLPEGYSIERSSARSRTAEQMLEAFTINLTALSLLALIVGIFLIYNSISFSVVQRKQQTGILRCIGVTSQEIFGLIIKESLIIGAAGTVIGLLLGYILSTRLVELIAQSINDLYFVVTVTEIHTDPLLIAKGAAAGMIATLLSALHPAWRASRIPPAHSLIRSSQETGVTGKLKLFTLAGILLLASGVIILLLPVNFIWLSYAGILPVILGFAALTPPLIVYTHRLVAPVMKRLFGLTGSIASGSMVRNISRTWIAIAALSVAVSASIGVGTMVSSFRTTVTEWLSSRLRADLYISAPSLVSRKIDGTLPESLPVKLADASFTRDMNFFREITIRQDEKQYRLLGVSMGKESYTGYRFKGGDPEDIWEKFHKGEILITEPFAFRHDLEAGDELMLKTSSGEKNFRVAGIYYDYASDEGLISMDYNHFKRNWSVNGISGIALFLNKGADTDETAAYIRNLSSDGQQFLIRTNKFLRESSIEIFDRTFLIAKALQLLAIIVAFAGILSSFMSVQLERGRELGIMRANGFLPRQIFGILTMQTSLMGLISGLLAIPLGTILAWVLVFIINKRSFGWTMQFTPVPSILLEGVVLALLAALIAGIYPGLKMASASPAAALRSE